MGTSTKKSKTKQTYTPPSWVEDASKDAISLGRKIGQREFTPYIGERIAGLSENERAGINLARTSAGGWQPYMDKASASFDSAGQDFTSADISAYMNPYIKGALDPAAREMRDQGALRLNDLRATQSQRSAFGGARGALMESETTKNIDEGIADHYAKGYYQAFESGADRWARDREMDFRTGTAYMTQSQAFRDANTADIQTLMQTGAVDRGIQQAMKDFDYSQFLEEQNWDVKNLSALIAAIQGTHGSYSTTQETTSKETTSANPVSQAMGVAAMVGGAMMGNPALMSAGAGMGSEDSGGGGMSQNPWGDA